MQRRNFVRAAGIAAAAAPDDQPRAFGETYVTLRRRAEAFLALPAGQITDESLNRIGTLP